ncbi:hypothetical protein Rsub_12495 [Raphidocelis subcapitata]|uniref:Uncharacterized protein n=1 Tax=Raphidocelis subcapitata TaxID=307507 RepID=A0A2V0PRF4_9CHLO|nr:hypothetical protein Rsub_12495 [Raphidocelis subcapitata]|eukprot:GBF99855.1 hypothetical protein Rsub_12495 [Raphidocelis subcapitata]
MLEGATVRVDGRAGRGAGVLFPHEAAARAAAAALDEAAARAAAAAAAAAAAEESEGEDEADEEAGAEAGAEGEDEAEAEGQDGGGSEAAAEEPGETQASEEEEFDEVAVKAADARAWAEAGEEAGDEGGAGGRSGGGGGGGSRRQQGPGQAGGRRGPGQAGGRGGWQAKRAAEVTAATGRARAVAALAEEVFQAAGAVDGAVAAARAGDGKGAAAAAAAAPAFGARLFSWAAAAGAALQGSWWQPWWWQLPFAALAAGARAAEAALRGALPSINLVGAGVEQAPQHDGSHVVPMLAGVARAAPQTFLLDPGAAKEGLPPGRVAVTGQLLPIELELQRRDVGLLLADHPAFSAEAFELRGKPFYHLGYNRQDPAVKAAHEFVLAVLAHYGISGAKMMNFSIVGRAARPGIPGGLLPHPRVAGASEAAHPDGRGFARGSMRAVFDLGRLAGEAGARRWAPRPFSFWRTRLNGVPTLALWTLAWGVFFDARAAGKVGRLFLHQRLEPGLSIQFDLLDVVGVRGAARLTARSLQAAHLQADSGGARGVGASAARRAAP